MHRTLARQLKRLCGVEAGDDNLRFAMDQHAIVSVTETAASSR